MTKHIEMTASVVAVILSAIAVYVSYLGVQAANDGNRAAAAGNAAAASGVQIAEQTRADTAKHNQLSLIPILDFSHQLGGGSENGFHFSIANYGLGPAIITSVHVQHGKLTSSGDIESLHLLTPRNLKFATKSLQVGQVLEPSKSYRLFESLTKDAGCTLGAIRKKFIEELKIEINYVSLYEISAAKVLKYKAPATNCSVITIQKSLSSQ